MPQNGNLNGVPCQPSKKVVFGLRKWNFLVFLALGSAEGGEGRKLQLHLTWSDSSVSSCSVALLPYCEVDCMTSKELCESLNVKYFPTLSLIESGQVTARL